MKAFLLSGAVCLFCFAALAQIPTSGLIAYYPFCGNANDNSGNALHGTVMGASLSIDRFGNLNQAYSFNGISDYIDLPAASFVGLNIYSYSIWIRPTSNAVSLAYCVGSNDLYCQSLSFNTTSVSAGSYNNGGNPVQSYVFSNTLPGINNWIHVVVTRDMSSLKMYVNGVLMSLSGSATNNQAASYGFNPPYKAVVGTRSTLQNYFFSGQIDDLRIYSTVLSQSDVNALYAETGALSSSIAITGNSVMCSGESTALTASGGGGNYNWSNAASGQVIVVSPTVNTVYSVKGITETGCVVNTSFTVLVNRCTGIDEYMANDKEIIVYPNPSSGSFIIQNLLMGKKQNHFILYNAQGTMVGNYDLDAQGNSINICSGLASGCYFGKWFADGRCIAKTKIIVIAE